MRLNIELSVAEYSALINALIHARNSGDLPYSDRNLAGNVCCLILSQYTRENLVFGERNGGGIDDLERKGNTAAG